MPRLSLTAAVHQIFPCGDKDELKWSEKLALELMIQTNLSPLKK